MPSSTKFATCIITLAMGISMIVGCSPNPSPNQAGSRAQPVPGATVPVRTNRTESTGTNRTISSLQTGAPISFNPIHASNRAYSVESLQFVNDREGWAAGQNFILHSTDGGIDWTAQYSGGLDIKQVDFLSAQVGYALGATINSANPSENPAKSKLYLLATTDGGHHYATVQVDGGGLPLQSATWNAKPNIHFFSPTVGMAYVNGSVDEGTSPPAVYAASAYLTRNGGHSWQAISLPKNSQSVWFTSADIGWAATTGTNGFSVERTTNGGRDWHTVLTVPSTSPRFGRIQAINSNEAWLLVYGDYGMQQQSYTLYHTSDAGIHWNVVIAHATAGGGPAPGVSGSGGYADGPGLVPGSLDVIGNGSAFLLGLNFPMGMHGVVTVGSTHDAGQTWTNSGVQFAGSDGQLSFIDGKNGWIASAIQNQYSTLYRTSDGGQSWYKAYVFGNTTYQTDTQLGGVKYSKSQLSQVRQTAQAGNIVPYVPSVGLAGDKFQFAKLNADKSLGLVYPHLWLNESSQPLPLPQDFDTKYNIQVGSGIIGNVYETYNQQGQLVVALYFQKNGTYVSMQGLGNAQNLSPSILAVIGASLKTLHGS